MGVNVLSWSLDKILYLIMVLAILFANGLDSFEKSVLILMLMMLISLVAIKEAVKNSNK